MLMKETLVLMFSTVKRLVTVRPVREHNRQGIV